MPDERPPTTEVAEEHYIVPDDVTNGRIPVLQTELRHIHDALKEQTAMFREHCRQAEETRKNQALILQEQAAHCARITVLTTSLVTKASTAEVEEIRRLIKNPWVIALGSGGTVGLILQLGPLIVKAFGGP